MRNRLKAKKVKIKIDEELVYEFFRKSLISAEKQNPKKAIQILYQNQPYKKYREKFEI
jgi:archaellum biogenesis protein FlaJ (TadC family)